jgi:hypothetical protein
MNPREALHGPSQLALVQTGENGSIHVLDVVVDAGVVTQNIRCVSKVLQARNDLIILLQAVASANCASTLYR